MISIKIRLIILQRTIFLTNQSLCPNHQGMSKNKICYILRDYNLKQHDELSVKRGDIVKVTIKYQARHKVMNSMGKIGWIPTEIISEIEIKESNIINNVAIPFERLIEISRIKKRRKRMKKKKKN